METIRADTRAEACATAEGLSIPEFVRVAVANYCQDVERRQGQRERLQRRATA